MNKESTDPCNIFFPCLFFKQKQSFTFFYIAALFSLYNSTKTKFSDKKRATLYGNSGQIKMKEIFFKLRLFSPLNVEKMTYTLLIY